MILKFRRNTPRNLILEASRSFAQVVRGSWWRIFHSFFIALACLSSTVHTKYSVCHAMHAATWWLPCASKKVVCISQSDFFNFSSNATSSTTTTINPKLLLVGLCTTKRKFYYLCILQKRCNVFFGKTRFFCEGVIYTAERMLLVCAVCII